MSGRRAQMWAMIRRDALIQFSYQFQLISLLTAPVATIFLTFYVSGLIDDPELLRAYRGGYFEYAVSGIGLTTFASFGVVAFTRQLYAEQSAGTLEVLLAGPSRLWVLLLGGAVLPFTVVFVQGAGLVVVGIGFIGSGLSPAGLLSAIPVAALTVVTFCCLGVLSAALVVLVKRGDPISGPLVQLMLIMSGAVVPVELFPSWLETCCRVNPAYYGVRGLRDALLTSGGFGSTVDEIVILTGFCVVLVPVSLRVFARSIWRAKQLGVLGAY